MPHDLAPLFKHYAELYMAGDAGAVADIYEAPFLAVRNGTPIPLADRNAVVEHLAGVMAAYRQAGAAAAEIAELDVLEQGDSAAVVTVRWHIRAPDGSLIRDFHTSYQLVGPAPWRIRSYVNHDMVRPAG